MRSTDAHAPYDPAGAAMLFDIQAQSLPEALTAFNEATGFSGLYTADAVAGRWSGAVQGAYSAQEALHKLLAPTGLSSYFTAPNAYVLEQGAPSAAPVRPSEVDYDTLLQSTVRSAFCRNALIVPGNYRVALSFRVAANGRVERAHLLDTTGNRARDVEILKTLRSVKLARGPANPAEPFVMLILPQEQAAVADCGAAP